MKEVIFAAGLGIASLGALSYQAEAGTWLMVAIAVFNIGFALVARRQGRERRAIMIIAIILALLASTTAAFVTPSGTMWLFLLIGATDVAMIWRWRWSTI
jgi:hypothetical protein